MRARAGFGTPIVVLGFVTLGFLYVALLLEPGITGFDGALRCQPGTNDIRCKLQLWDSYRYMETSRTTSIDELVGRVREVIAGNAALTPFVLNNIGLYIQGRLAHVLAPAAPQLAVFAMNLALYLWALVHIHRLMGVVGLGGYNRVLLFILLNPLVLMYAASLTKEAWGIFFVCAFARYCVERRFVALCAVAALSAMFRNLYPIVALAFAAGTLVRVRVVWVFLGFSLVLGTVLSLDHPLIEQINAVRLYKASDLGQQTSSLMGFLAALQDRPLGNVVAAPVIAAVNIASPALNPKVYTEHLLEPTWALTTLSSYLMIGLIAAGAVRHARRPDPEGRRYLLRLVLLFLVLITVYPISQHRYLIPVYPLLVAWALASPARRVAGRVRPLSPQPLGPLRIACPPRSPY